MWKHLAFMFCLGALAVPAQAATSWSTSGLATTGNVTIAAGQSIILDQNINLVGLTINGELVCGDKNLSVSANWISVHGRFACGTQANPYTKNLTITLTGSNQVANVMNMGTKFLAAMGGGQIELHGEPRKGWTRLGRSAIRGTKTVALSEAVTWRVGDTIVFVSTDFNFGHAEERTIVAISGKSVTLNAALTYDHYCGTFTYGNKSMSECGEVGLASRNIVIKGDASSKVSSFGGHMMIMAGSSAKLDGVEFLNMGQKGKLARYPFHWHLTGNATGQYITNSSIVHSYNRFLAIHGTHNTLVKGNFAYDTIGHGYYMEDGIETGNVIEDNLGAVVRNATSELPSPSDKEATVFWITNPNNTIRRNVSAGSEHSGFWLGFPDHPIGLSATNTVWPRHTPLKEFSGNVSHSNNAHGLFVDGAEDANRRTQVTWYEPLLDPANQKSAKVQPFFRNFTAYKNRAHGVWMRGFSYPVLQSPRLADNAMGAYFATVGEKAGYIQDGLVIGETPNKGNPEPWEPRGVDGRELPTPWKPKQSVRGLEFYDGPMVIRRNTFVNFKTNSLRKAGGITNLSPNPFWISSRNTAYENKFVNAVKVWLDPLTTRNDGDAYSVFRDADGSLSGIKGRMIVPPNGLLVTSSCMRMASWNAYVCPHSYANLQINTAAKDDFSGSLLKRTDGKSRVVGSSEIYPGSFHFNLIAGQNYHLQLVKAPPKRIEFARNEQAGKAVRLSLDYPTSNFTLKLWGYDPVAKATSLAALSTGGTKYYYDAVKKRLHLRFVSDDGQWKGYVLQRP
jgi:cell surface hyaluronidase